MRAAASSTLVAAALAVTMMGTTLPSPLYPLYEKALAIPPVVTPIVFATYALGVIAALLFLGYLSDEIGRRRMMVPALVVAALSAVVFLVSGSLALLFVGRFLSGLSAGVVSGAGTAWLVDLGGKGKAEEERSTLVAMVANFGGLACGPLLSGLLAAYAPGPLRLSYVVTLALVVPALAGVFFARETKPVASPRVRLRVQALKVQEDARSIFFRAVIAGGCGFAVSGVVNAVAPSFLGKELHLKSPAVAGALVFGFFASAVLGQVAVRKLPPKAALASGCVALLLGLGLLALSLVTRSAGWLFASDALTGVGQGLAVGAGLSELNAKLGDKRGETDSTYFVVLYAGVTMSTVGVGFLASASSVIVAGLVFCGVAALAVLGALGMIAIDAKKET